jgi:2-succinyl-5-enolpyruvyl-6-hydroxy-3-cyclohexene-1-carboxylate synthase
VIVSTLCKEDREAVVKFLVSLNAPVFLESISGIGHESCLKHLSVVAPDLKWHDAVLRIGGVPTHRIWRDLENRQGSIDVLSITEHPFSALSYAPFIHTKLAPFFSAFKLDLARQWQFPSTFYPLQKQLLQELDQLLIEGQGSEPAWIRTLSSQLPQSAQIFLGNSMPIRAWDLAADKDKAFEDIIACRGLNGIDGQISAFLGSCDHQRLNVAVLGDLTALYDFAALWGLQDKPHLSYCLIVINNAGGQIFSKKFSNPVFLNAHSLNFASFASFWNVPYQKWASVPDNIQWQGLIEIVPDNALTDRFFKKWEALI